MRRSQLYIAYGSNINIKQMKNRCPTARPVVTAMLKGYRLVFRGGHDSAVATVEPYREQAVPVALWEIKDADEAALDRYEGWPYLYRKEYVPVEWNGMTEMAMLYVMNPGRPIGQPSAYYFSIIREGYEDFGLDTAYLHEATETPADDDGWEPLEPEVTHEQD